jgi:hypothetical protein
MNLKLQELLKRCDSIANRTMTTETDEQILDLLKELIQELLLQMK